MTSTAQIFKEIYCGGLYFPEDEIKVCLAPPLLVAFLRQWPEMTLGWPEMDLVIRK